VWYYDFGTEGWDMQASPEEGVNNIHSLRIMSYNILADLLVSLSVGAALDISQHVSKGTTPASE